MGDFFNVWEDFFYIFFLEIEKNRFSYYAFFTSVLRAVEESERNFFSLEMYI